MAGGHVSGHAGIPARTRITVGIGLVALVWLVFGQTLGHGFFNYDDDSYVYQNEHVVSGLSIANVSWAFTHAHSGNWHPITSLSHMLDCQLFGLKAEWHHATNAELHGIAVLLLWLALARLTGSAWRSAFVAALFAIHPQRVESVAWISERKDVLSGVFFAWTLLAYVGYVDKPRVGRYLLVAVSFALGLMSKPTLVPLPIALLLLDYWPLRRSRTDLRRILLEKLPLLGLSLLASVATLVAQRATVASVEKLPLLLRIANAFESIVLYLWQFVWPAALAPFYPHPAEAISIPAAIGAAAFTLATSAAVILWRRRCPYLLTGWFWYLAMLFPVVGLVQVGAQARADRYTYLSHMGVYLGLTWLVTEACEGKIWLKRVLSSSTAVLIGLLAWQAIRQTSYWRAPTALWQHTIQVTAPNAVAHHGLGHFYLENGRLDEAISEFKGALEIRADYTVAAQNLGVALTKADRTTEAIELLRRLVADRPGDAMSHFYLADALSKKGWRSEAIEHYRTTLRLEPALAEANLNLGSALLQDGDVDGAIREFETALQVRPRYAEAEYNLGGAYLAKGALNEASIHLEKALKIKPDYAQAENNLGLVSIRRNNSKDAIAHWRRAAALSTEFGEARNNLAWILATSPDPAVRDGRAALDLAKRAEQLSGGRDAGILRTVAAAYAETGDFAAATANARRAVELAMSQSNFSLIDALEADLLSYNAGAAIREGDEDASSH